MTSRPEQWATREVGAEVHTVTYAAVQLGVAWHTVTNAVVYWGDKALIGVDETKRLAARQRLPTRSEARHPRGPVHW